MNCNLMMKNSNILLIIANGPSALKNNLGHEIDKFNEIGRINNYTTNNFEKFIGSKTNIWFNGANQGLRPRKNIPKKTIILVPYEILFRKEEKIIEKIPRKLNLNDDDLNYIADKACAIPKEKRTLGSIFKYAVFKKPSLLIDVLKVFTGY